MPCQSLLIERNDHLRAAGVGFTGRDQICFIRVFPEKRENIKAHPIPLHFTPEVTLSVRNFCYILTSPGGIHQGRLSSKALTDLIGILNVWRADESQFVLPAHEEDHFRLYSPLHQEHQLPTTVCGTNDPLWLQVPSKATWFLGLNDDNRAREIM